MERGAMVLYCIWCPWLLTNKQVYWIFSLTSPYSSYTQDRPLSTSALYHACAAHNMYVGQQQLHTVHKIIIYSSRYSTCWVWDPYCTLLYEQGNPLTSYPFNSVPSCVWGKNLLFPPPLAYNDLSTLIGHEESIYGLGICEVPAFTVPVEWVLTCIYPVVYTVQQTVLNGFKLRQLIENTVFYPQGGCGGQKKISPSGT